MYGYVGDETPDSNSLRGIGAFPHTSKPGSLVPNYSAALTDADAARRGLKPGDEFEDQGRTLRYDDRQPGSKLYVDVYTPDHAPDAGVSQAEIDRQAGIAAGRPEIGTAGERTAVTGRFGGSTLIARSPADPFKISRMLGMTPLEEEVGLMSSPAPIAQEPTVAEIGEQELAQEEQAQEKQETLLANQFDVDNLKPGEVFTWSSDGRQYMRV